MQQTSVSTSSGPRVTTCASPLIRTPPTRSYDERRPNLSIVELMIAGGGLALCERLTQRDDAPLLAVSALALRKEALAAGASAFLQKPLEPLQFVSTVRDLLGSSALRAPRSDARQLMERLSTGDARLDEILCGGFIANAITMISGEPGTARRSLRSSASSGTRHLNVLRSISRPCRSRSTSSFAMGSQWSSSTRNRLEIPSSMTIWVMHSTATAWSVCSTVSMPW